jgi:cellulose synthase operon protein C
VVVVGNPFENLEPAAALLERSGHNAQAIEFLDQLVKSAPWNPSFRLRLAKAKLAAGQDATAGQGALTSIASGSNSPYDLRIEAALGLGGRSHPDLGSGELNLLAGNPAALPATAADKFYFYEARINTAQRAVDPQTKVQLLSHCVIDFPGRDEARILLFKAAVSVRSDEIALGALEPLLTRFLGRFSASVDEEEEIVSSEAPEETNNDDSTTPAVAASALSRVQRAQVGKMIGDAMVRLNRLSDAVPYFENARQSESSAPARKELNRKIADAKATLRLQRQNAARQPLLHEALEQDRVVRPRLLARAVPVPKAATVKGGVKQ